MRRFFHATGGGWAGAAAGALAGCSRTPRPAPLVSIVRANSYSQDLADLVRRILVEQQGAGSRQADRAQAEPGGVRPRNHHQHASGRGGGGPGGVPLARRCPRFASPRGRVTAATRWSWPRPAGYFQAIPRFEELFTDLNLDDVERVRVPGAHSLMKSVYLPADRARPRTCWFPCPR